MAQALSEDECLAPGYLDDRSLNGADVGGAPCIRGLRIPVSVVVDMVADGMPAEEILDLYPDLEREDISEALRFAAEAVRERELPLASNS